MKLLWLLPDFGYSSAVRQASLVVPELVRANHHCVVAGLRGGGPLVSQLKDAGVEVVGLSTPHDFPLQATYNLKSLIRERQPEVIHGWRLPVVRALSILSHLRMMDAKLVLSQARKSGRATSLDRWWIRRFPGVMDPVVPLAAGSAPEPRARDPWRIACLGTFDRAHGFRDALWAFDVLRYVFPELKLEITGSGPERQRLLAFAQSGGQGFEKIDFRPTQPDAARLAEAAMVWIPSRAAAGEQVALEAQAAGTPVIATQLPGLSASIADGETGILIPPAEPVALARAARKLIENPGELRRLGDAGPAYVAREHAPAKVATQWLEVYTKALTG